MYQNVLRLDPEKRTDIQYRATTQAIALSPNDFDMYFMHGFFAMYLQQYYEAVQIYGQTIRLKPKRADAHSAMGVALFALQEFDKAQHAFTRALQHDPHDADALQYLSQLKNRSTP